MIRKSYSKSLPERFVTCLYNKMCFSKMMDYLLVSLMTANDSAFFYPKKIVRCLDVSGLVAWFMNITVHDGRSKFKNEDHNQCLLKIL